MNLYQIMIRHYAPRDSRNGIWGYLLANNSKEVYEWLKSEPTVDDDVIDNLHLCWDSWEEEDGDYENFAEQMIRLQDEEATDRANYDDLYYGKTFVSWDKVYGDIDTTMTSMLEKSGVRIFRVGGE